MNNKTENWIHLDAEGKTLGRLSTDISIYLQGKDRPDYSPHTLSPNFVVITNVDKITVTGNKLKGKEIYIEVKSTKGKVIAWNNFNN